MNVFDYLLENLHSTATIVVDTATNSVMAGLGRDLRKFGVQVGLADLRVLREIVHQIVIERVEFLSTSIEATPCRSRAQEIVVTGAIDRAVWTTGLAT